MLATQELGHYLSYLGHSTGCTRPRLRTQANYNTKRSEASFYTSYYTYTMKWVLGTSMLRYKVGSCAHLSPISPKAKQFCS